MVRLLIIVAIFLVINEIYQNKKFKEQQPPDTFYVRTQLNGKTYWFEIAWRTAYRAPEIGDRIETRFRGQSHYVHADVLEVRTDRPKEVPPDVHINAAWFVKK